MKSGTHFCFGNAFCEDNCLCDCDSCLNRTKTLKREIAQRILSIKMQINQGMSDDIANYYKTILEREKLKILGKK